MYRARWLQWYRDRLAVWCGSGLRCGKRWAQRRSHDLGKSFAGLSGIMALSNPYLRDILGIDGGHGGVEGHPIEHAVNGGGEKDEGHALSRLNIQVERGKAGGAPTSHVVEVEQDSNCALTAVGGKAKTVFRAQVEGVVVL